jgi:uncharacterized membrane protein YqjE
MNVSNSSRPGLWGLFNRVLDALLATAQNRVQLLAVECQEERCRTVEAVVLAMAVGTLGGLALLLCTLTVIVLFWDSGRIVALLSLTGIYLLGAIAVWRVLRARLQRHSPFGSTIDELRKDRSCLSLEN